MRHLLALAAFAIVTAIPDTARAQSANEHDAHHPAKANATAPDPLADGEVRKVDKEAGKITLRHGPIPNLEMPEMTMVFRVKDPAMLEQVKAGDKIRFAAEKIGGLYTVTRLEPRP